MVPQKKEKNGLSRRTFLLVMSWTPLLFVPAPLFASPFHPLSVGPHWDATALPLTDFRLTPHYPTKSPLDDLLRLVVPGGDEYVTEKYAYEIMPLLNAWSDGLKAASPALADLAKFIAPAIEATPLIPAQEIPLRSGGGIEIIRRRFTSKVAPGREQFLRQIETYLAAMLRIETAEFQIVGIEEISGPSLIVHIDIRYDFVGVRKEAG